MPRWRWFAPLIGLFLFGMVVQLAYEVHVNSMSAALDSSALQSAASAMAALTPLMHFTSNISISSESLPSQPSVFFSPSYAGRPQPPARPANATGVAPGVQGLLPQGAFYEADISTQNVTMENLSWVNWVWGSNNLPFTREAQAVIWFHQHPRDCASSKFLVWKMFQKGLGADMHHVSGALASAMNMGRILIVNSTLHGGDWKYARGLSPPHPDFYFEPLTNCTWDHVMHSSKLYIGPDYPNIKPSARHSLEMPVRWERMGYTWWRAQSIRYIMRPNRWFVEYLAAVNDALDRPVVIPPASISIHIRRSDKVGSFSKGKEMDAVPLSDYMEYAEQIRKMYPEANTVMLSSEDGSIFRQAQQYTNFTFLSVPEERANLNHDQFVKRFGAVKMMEVSMLNLLFHQQCQFFIHTRKSNWCRLVDEFRLTNNKYNNLMVWVNGAPSNGPI